MGFPWGLDLGNQNCVLAVARKGGVDVIDNEASLRRTPSMVGLGGKERVLGEAARSKIASNITNTVSDLKRLIGRKFADAELQKDKEHFPFKIVEAPDGGILIELTYEKEGEGCEVMQFTPEQLLGMLFVNLKSIAERHNKSPSPDCVVSVPNWFTDPQRRAVLDAGNIAGLNILRLMNETAAIALCWGLPKSQELPDDSAQPKHVLFYDMGHSSTEACVVAFTKSKMTVVSSAFDRNLGGRDFDMALLNYFANEWKNKTGLDIYSSNKAKHRLLVAIDKVKQQLSGYTTYTKLPVNVECLQEERDFSSFIDTDIWQNITQQLVERALEPVKACVRDAKVNFDSIEDIEVVGSATRSPLIVGALRNFLGKEPKRTMNSEEAVAKGCALAAAMMSPTFKVREFSIADSVPYPIALSWSPSSSSSSSSAQDGGEQMEVEGSPAAAKSAAAGGGGAGNNIVFQRHSVMPSVKMLTFMRASDFDITATYADPSDLPPLAAAVAGTAAAGGEGLRHVDPYIGTFHISNVPSTGGAGGGDGGARPVKIKVKVRLDINGLVSVESAQAVEETEVGEGEEEEEQLEGGSKKRGKKSAASAGDVPMADAAPVPPDDAALPREPAAEVGEGVGVGGGEGGSAAAPPAPAESVPAVPAKKKKVKKHELKVTTTGLAHLPAATIDQYKQAEFEMAQQDRRIRELQEAKNDLESYIYAMRERIGAGGDLSEYLTDSAKAELTNLLDGTEEWLYSDSSESAPRSVFVAKLEELKKIGGPAEERAREGEDRPAATAALQSALGEYADLMVAPQGGAKNAAYDHIPEQDRLKVQNEVKQAREWLEGKLKEQGGKGKADPPAVTAREIRAKIDAVHIVCRPIKNRPRPAAPKPAAAADPPKPDDSNKAGGDQPPAAATEAAGAEAPKAATASGAPAAADGMDVGLD